MISSCQLTANWTTYFRTNFYPRTSLQLENIFPTFDGFRPFCSGTGAETLIGLVAQPTTSIAKVVIKITCLVNVI